MPDTPYLYPYNFTEDSKRYRCSISNTRPILQRFVGEPIRCLEIGIYEGGSSTWLLENILTNDKARYVGIDFAMRQNAIDNLEWHQSKVTLLKGDSKRILPTLVQPFDLMFIDGDHSYEGVFNDLFHAWKLAKNGTVILCDDYTEGYAGVVPGVNRFLAGLDANEYKIVLSTEQHIAFQRTF